MSEQSTPPRPKPGSLRDRIAAFEKPAGGAAPGPAPVPRPKPGGISWKPKAPSPPSSPSAPDASSDKKLGSMSASDAKESIKTGGSLKERMAALQNRGGFGGPPPVAPKPPMEKPKWKPPPVIAPVDKDDDDEPSRDGEQSKPPPPVRKSTSEDRPAEEKDEGEPIQDADDNAGEAAVADPEEEERQRRAAIAARMARLGGARVGMAPVFGRASSTKKVEHAPKPVQSETPAEETPDEGKPAKEATPPLTTDEIAAAPASDEQPSVTLDSAGPPSAPVRKDSQSSPSLSSEPEVQSTRGAPTSMPIPSAPRRAAPPRRKTPKSPEVTHIVSEQVVSSPENVPVLGEQDILDTAPAIHDNADKERVGNVQQEVSEVDKAAEPEPPVTSLEAESSVPVTTNNDDEELSGGVGATEPEAVAAATSFHSSEISADADDDEEDTEDSYEKEEPSVQQPPHPEVGEQYESVALVEKEHEESEHDVEEEVTRIDEQVAQAVEEPDEDEEAARRQRIAEKLAKMGGVNPFALPPQRKASSSSEDVQTSPTLAKRSSISRNSVASPPPLPPTQRRQSTRDSFTEPPAAEPVRVQSPESKPENDAPLSPPLTRENTTNIAISEHADDESEDDSRDVSQHTGTATGVTPALDNDNDTDPTADQESKTDYETVSAADETYKGLAYKSEDLSDVEPEAPHPPPPIANVATRPANIPTIPVDPALPINPISHVEESTPAVAPAISPRRSIPPPPPRLVPELTEPEEEYDDSEVTHVSSPLASPSPVSYQPSEEEDEEPLRHLPPRRDTADDEPPLPVPNRRSLHSEDFIPPNSKRLSARPSRSIPLPPSTISAPVSDVDDSDFDEVLPTPPRHRPMTPGTPPAPPNEIPLIVPPPAGGDVSRRAEPSPLRHTTVAEQAEQINQVPSLSGETSSNLLSPPVKPPSHKPHHEVLDDEEGDPIDPSFHSPSRRSSLIAQSAPRASEPASAPEEDEQAARHRTIAERMAKLGGIKFGAAPLPHSMRPPPPAPKEEDEDHAQNHDKSAEQPAEVTELTEEEEERARKERIAAKLAMMGGMRIGMMPLGVGTVRPQVSHALAEERPFAPPSRAPPSRPPPPPQIPHHDELLSASLYSNPTSDEGVKVEAEDSEIEEVSYEDAQETEEEPEEVPPPVPVRGPRRRDTASSETEYTPVSPPSRPPVPTTSPARRASVQSTSSTTRRSSSDSTQGLQKASTYKPQSDYVMVEEPSGFENEEVPPPPPARPSHRPPPSRTAPPPPPPPQPSVPMSDSISSQWEMPSIPSSSIEFSTPAEISLTWPEDSSPTSPRSPPLPPPPKPSVSPDLPRSSDDLMTIWGRVGVQICEVATTLFEKSKKSLVGDGTYDGFIHAVLSEVPNAAMPASGEAYGYLVYAQSGNAVQKRASEILPGDILVLQDAKLKGHKGLQSYHQNVGIGEPLVGVVSEFEPKKSKVRLFQANQHVGQQTVEAVSYRLEDLKSGSVKVFRVLEN